MSNQKIAPVATMYPDRIILERDDPETGEIVRCTLYIKNGETNVVLTPIVDDSDLSNPRLERYEIEASGAVRGDGSGHCTILRVEIVQP